MADLVFINTSKVLQTQNTSLKLFCQEARPLKKEAVLHKIWTIQRSSSLCFCHPKLLQEKNIRGICLQSLFSCTIPPSKVKIL